MKNLSYYKSLYKKAKTGKTRSKIMNFVMLNLGHSDQQNFIKWQVNNMNNTL